MLWPQEQCCRLGRGIYELQRDKPLSGNQEDWALTGRMAIWGASWSFPLSPVALGPLEVTPQPEEFETPPEPAGPAA